MKTKVPRVYESRNATFSQVPSCVSNASLHLETDIVKVEARISLAFINSWLMLNYNPQGLIPLIL